MTTSADPEVLLDLLVRTREDVERDRVAHAAATWERIAGELNRIADGLDPHQGETFRHSWQGRAADAATAAFERIAASAREHAGHAQSVADALRSGEAAVNDVSHKVFTEIGTKLQAEKRGGLFGGVVDWVEDRFDDQPDVDRDEQIKRVHATYGEFIGAMQEHSHGVREQFPAAAPKMIGYDEQVEFVPTSSTDSPTPMVSSGSLAYVESFTPSRPHLLTRSAAQHVPESIQPAHAGPRLDVSAPDPATASTVADQQTDATAHLGLLGGGVAAVGAAGIAAGAVYGLGRRQPNAGGPASAGASTPAGIGGSPGRGTAGPVLGGTVTTPASGSAPVSGTAAAAGARTPTASPAAGMVGAIGGTPPTGSGPKAPNTRYGPAPTLPENTARSRRRKRRDVLGPGSRRTGPPPSDDAGAPHAEEP